MKEKLSLANFSPWYKEGLKFKCTGCGKCCTGGPGAVWISEDEISEISEHLHISIKEFLAKYTHLIDGKRSLKEDSKSFDCVFLNGKKCEIYALRPKQCRTYPWWGKVVESEASWKEEAKWCEGINHPEASVVPCSEILKNL